MSSNVEVMDHDGLVHSRYPYLVENSKRPCAGAECLIEMRNQACQYAIFFCEVCCQKLNEENLQEHVQNYTHIFRYFKKYWKNEFNRMIKQEIKDSIKAMVTIIAYFSKIKSYQRKIPKIIQLDDFRDEILHTCISYYSQKCERVELDEQFDASLKELNKKDSESNEIYQRALQRARRDNRCLSQSIKNDPEDDISSYVTVESTSRHHKSHQKSIDKPTEIDNTKLPPEIRESIARNLAKLVKSMEESKLAKRFIKRGLGIEIDTSDEDESNNSRQSNKRKNEDTNETQVQKPKRTKLSNLSDKEKQIRNALKQLSQLNEPSDLIVNEELMFGINEFLDKKRVNISQNQFTLIMTRLHRYVERLNPYRND